MEQGAGLTPAFLYKEKTMYTLSKERKAQIERYVRITGVIEENYTPLKIVDLNYDEKKGWVGTFEKIDPKLFDTSKDLTEILDTVNTTAITHCEHNVTGKRYKINQGYRIRKHNFDVEVKQELEQA